MSVEWEEKYEALPHNGAEGQPCKNGCILGREKATGKLFAMGDCRNPYSDDCVITKQMNEYMNNKK
jgi:hypothetical protein